MTSSPVAPLLTAKLSIPLPDGDWLARPALLARLDAALTRRVTLLLAPAGYGKTALLSQWIAAQTGTPNGNPPSIGWLALDEEDQEIHCFLAYLLAVLASTVAALPGKPRPTPAPLVLKLLLNELTERAKAGGQRLILVLDDYHHIQNQEIHQAITFLVEHAPPHCHLVLLSRHEPPLPLARWRARGQLTELRLDVLRFTESEAETFLAQRLPTAYGPAMLAQMVERLDGWPAALQLGLLSAHSHPPGEAVTSLPATLDRYLFDYLAEEIFRTLDPTLRHFLLHVSILEQLSAPLCDAVIDGGQSEAQLAQLLRANLPLSPLGDADGWYRLSPLWRDFLLARLRQGMPQAVPLLHRRALAWYEATGWIEAALTHALAAQAPDEAARLLSRHASTLLRRGQVAALHGWLCALPEATILTTPRLAIARIWTLLDRGQLNLAAPYLDALHNHLAHQPAAGERGEILALRALSAAISHQPATALTLAHQAEEAITGADPALQPYVAFSLGMAYRMAFDPARAEPALREAAAQATAQDNPYIATSAWANLGLMVLDYGHLTEAEQINRRLLALLQNEPGVESADAALHHLDLARIYYEWNELEQATSALQRSLALCTLWDNRPLKVRALFIQSQILQARHRLADAQAVLEQADGLARQTGDRVLVHSVVRRSVLLALAQGDLPRARQWAHQLPAVAEPYAFFTALMEARLLLATGEPGHALEHLAGAWEELATAQLLNAQIQTLALQALAHAAYRQSHQAATALHAALALGARERYTRTFLDLGPPLERLLRMIPVPAELSTYVAHLLAAFAADTADAPATLLTPRELEILRLLALGYSNQAMADRLVISPATLKRHVSNLYLKLAVHSRTQALARAAELHLL